MSKSASQILSLYKRLIKESERFASLNIREYSKKRIRYEFRQNKQLDDQEKLKSLVQKAENNLKLIQRQALISQLYPTERTVIEQ